MLSTKDLVFKERLTKKRRVTKKVYGKNFAQIE